MVGNQDVHAAEPSDRAVKNLPRRVGGGKAGPNVIETIPNTAELLDDRAELTGTGGPRLPPRRAPPTTESGR